MLDPRDSLPALSPGTVAAPDDAAAAPTQTVDLVYFNAGGGHRTSALALQSVIAEQRRPWRVRLVNLTEVLDARDIFRRATGMAPEHLYNVRLQRGWTLGLAQELKLLQTLIRVGHKPMLRALQQHWRRTQPDLVVSLIPNFNRVLYDSVAGALPGAPFVTVMTDLADHPPNFWIEPGQDQHIVCGTPRAMQQAAAMGYPAEQLHLTSGMVLRPEFHRLAPIDRDAEHRRLGLDPRLPTVVVMFGGHGSRAMLEIARQLRDRQLILLCGHNDQLASALRRQPAEAPRLVLGFTPQVMHYLRLGDLFIGKPGPASLCEAVHLGLPVVTVRNAWTMPQERYNTQWVRDNGLGVVHDSFRTIRPAVDEVLARLPQLRRNLRAINNRAVFEVPEVLARVLAAGGRTERGKRHGPERTAAPPSMPAAAASTEA
jgi:UDP-N-acetylglucosamine:LPS N-acetylglucosamine transferase